MTDDDDEEYNSDEILMNDLIDDIERIHGYGGINSRFSDLFRGLKFGGNF